jgi:hypothetical protein
MHLLRTGVVLPTHPLRKALGIIAGAFLTIVAQTDGATINAASAALADVTSAISSASDGDTVVVPAGSADWTSVLTITKGITLLGATTVTNPGTQNPSVNDLTIIRDDSPLNTKQSGLIQANLNPSQSFRLTGFTFTHGSRTTANDVGVVHLQSSTSSSPQLNMRVDHCHFDQIYGRNIQTDGWVYGVADHNYIIAQGNGQSFYINCATYGGYTLGNGAWTDFPWFGTNKFFFIEDNTIVGNGNVSTSGAMDAEYGARWVARHNDLTNAHIGWHGTEGSSRGCRAVEIYNNSFHWALISMASQKNRSGVSLQHDNTWAVSGTDGSQSQINVYREMGAVTTNSTYGISDGTSVWDANDTEGNGTYVGGHSPHLFDKGTATAASTQSGSQATLTDSSKHWTPNQWVGYSVTQTNPSATSYKKGSFIISNTATTITYFLYTSGDRGPLFVFSAGDTYEIHRVLTAIDQGGRGKGDLLSGSNSVNTVTGVPGWPHQALEPAFSWNNVTTPTNTAWGFTSGMPTVVEGRDYYNLGAGFAANTAPSQVSSTYTASLNGVAYTRTYVYPHPLVSGAPAPPSAPTNLRVVLP